MVSPAAACVTAAPIVLKQPPVPPEFTHRVAAPAGAVAVIRSAPIASNAR